jgi:PKD repeat protein
MNATTPGSYTVVVTGSHGTLSHTTSIPVTVVALAPTARFTFSPAEPIANDSVLFDASSSSDSDPNASLQARWDWEGDGLWDTPWSLSLTAQHVFTAAGSYPVALEVLDSHGQSDTVSHSVLVANATRILPQVTILSPSDGTIVPMENVTVVGIAAGNVTRVELSTDNRSWVPTTGTTFWTGTVSLRAGPNKIYARATDVSGNKHVAVVTVIAGRVQGPPAFPAGADPTVPVLAAISAITVLVGVHAFLWDRSRTPRKGRPKKPAVVGQPPIRDRWLLAAKGLLKR